MCDASGVAVGVVLGYKQDKLFILHIILEMPYILLKRTTLWLNKNYL